MNNKNTIIFFLIIVFLGGLVTFLLFGSKEKPQLIEEKTTISDEEGIGIEASPLDYDTPPKLSGGMDLPKNYEEKFEEVEDTVSGVRITDIKEILSFPNNTLDTSDWKTYRNEIYKFELKYPKDWVIEDRLAIGQNKETGKDSVYFYGNDYYYYNNIAGSFGAKLINEADKIDIFSVYNDSINKRITDYNSEYEPQQVSLRYSSKHLFKLNNTIVNRIQIEGNANNLGTFDESKYIIANRIGTNNITFEFSIIKDQYIEAELEQILLSFKILE